jgi:hypothetical protein
MSAPIAEKICIVCKQDCSKKPRSKDAMGRYVCDGCISKVQAKASAPARETQPASKLGQPEQPDRPAQPDIVTADEELVDLLTPPPAPKAGDRQFSKLKPSGGGGDVIGVDGDLPDPSVRHCQKCHAAMPGSGRVCQSCGHDPGTMSIEKVPKHLRTKPVAKCQGCGYDMRGAPSDVCPECGKKQRMEKAGLLALAEKDAKDALYKPPLLMMGFGWAATVVILLFEGTSAPAAILVTFLSWLLAVPVGVIAFWLCSLFYIEYDAPWHATAMRLAGIYAVVQVPWALAGVIGINAFGVLALFIFAFVLLIGLYMSVMELDPSEAVLLSFATRGVWFTIYLVLRGIFL